VLSVLIPVYNDDVRALVKTLHAQCLENHIAFEIIVLDDHSILTCHTANAAVTKYQGVIYQRLDHNISRAAIRNKLAAMASYPYLLFMDSDSGVTSDHYIAAYIGHCSPGTVVCGGRVYSPVEPAAKALKLHWYYGSKREQHTAAQRSLHPYRSFMTNNFLIPRDLFLTVQFDESITEYGHEDTLFGYELKKRNVQVLHINNPLMHDGLVPSGQFLEKVSLAVRNLAVLYQKMPSQIDFAQDITLLSAYTKLQKAHLVQAFRLFSRLLLPFIRLNLKSNRPSLRLLDIYKLHLFIAEK